MSAENTWGFDPVRQARMDVLDEQGHLNAMFESFEALKQKYGWKEAMYMTRERGDLQCIEPGSTGIHRCIYEGEWPDGRWWIIDGDMWPSRPILVRKARGEQCT